MANVADLFARALEYHRAGNLHQAEQVFRHILQADSSHADTYYWLGVLALQQGRPDQAMASMRQAVDLRPDNADAHCGLGIAVAGQGNFVEAVRHYRNAIELRPHFPDAYNNLGSALMELGRLNEALTHYRTAIHCRSDLASAHTGLGIVLLRLGKLAEARASFGKALQINPTIAEAHNGLGLIAEQHNDLDEALERYRQAIGLRFTFAEAHNNLGGALLELGQLDEAVTHFRIAIHARPDLAKAHTGLGIALLRLGKLDEGQASIDQALQLDPFVMQPEIHWRDLPQPLWDGSDLSGRTILLYADQGHGDTLQFIRYAQPIKQRGARVIVECPPALLKLLAGIPEIDVLVAPGDPLPQFDIQAPLLGLPALTHTTLAAGFGPIPYIRAKCELMDHWQKELEPLPGFKVGIAWQGNPAFRFDHMRSVPLGEFAPLARLKGIQLISLQKGPGSEQLQKSCQLSAISDQSNTDMEKMAVHDLCPDLDEATGAFMDTAAVMTNLDLVICTDSAVAHLAGALGVPVWLILGVVPDWRWLLQREDCPWYPGMRLFRQTRRGHWQDVLERVAAELQSVSRASLRT